MAVKTQSSKFKIMTAANPGISAFLESSFPV
jgi:hypothetical protein